MQATNETLSIIEDEEGELKDYLINIDQKDIFNPNLNKASVKPEVIYVQGYEGSADPRE